MNFYRWLDQTGLRLCLVRVEGGKLWQAQLECQFGSMICPSGSDKTQESAIADLIRRIRGTGLQTPTVPDSPGGVMIFAPIDLAV